MAAIFLATTSTYACASSASSASLSLSPTRSKKVRQLPYCFWPDTRVSTKVWKRGRRERNRGWEDEDREDSGSSSSEWKDGKANRLMVDDSGESARSCGG